MYELIGNPDIEIYIGEWTIMSLNSALEKYDQYSFDPSYKSLPLEHFEPMVRRIFSRKPYSS